MTESVHVDYKPIGVEIDFPGPQGPPGPPGNALTFGTFTQMGPLFVGSGVFKMPFAIEAKIIGVQLAVGTSPTGADLIVDIHKGPPAPGTSIFNPANRPKILDGDADGVGMSTTPDVTDIAVGEYLTVDIDQVGSNEPGANLTVAVQWEPA